MIKRLHCTSRHLPYFGNALLSIYINWLDTVIKLVYSTYLVTIMIKNALTSESKNIRKLLVTVIIQMSPGALI